MLADDDKVVQAGTLSRKQKIAGVIVLVAAIVLGQFVPTIEIAWVSAILLLTVYLFAFEIVGVDVAAATVMVLLGLTTLFAPIMGLEQGLVDSKQLFNGFASNAVMSIIAVMIIGSGLDKTGLMGKVASFILKVGGTTEKRIIPIISGTVAFISSFMQNVGAAALFIPVVSRISARSGLPMSRLLMPMGFCAILGGTMTMIGSSPLILLNDLILTSNKALPPDQQMHTWSLFSVTPIGVVLVAVGVLYFVIAGKFVLPAGGGRREDASGMDTMGYLRETYGLDYSLFEVFVPKESAMCGKTLEQIECARKIRVVASMAHQGDGPIIGPGALDRETEVQPGAVLGVLASQQNVEDFVAHFGLTLREELDAFEDALSSAKAGIADVVITPGSSLVGKSARDVWMRKTYGLALIAMHRNGETFKGGEGLLDKPLQTGDTLVTHTTWEAYNHLKGNRDFIQVTTEYPHEETRPNKVCWAGFFFATALGLILFTDTRLSVALLAGAIGMVWARVLTIEEAYEAVSWKTVFLLASLIPLGLAVETSGTAKWIADQVLLVVGDMPIWVIQSSIAVLATFFTLVMSNVGATVLLVPLAVNIAIGVGADPAFFALTVAIATSNSFLIPTHQVNALTMGPGGYRVTDYMRAGGVMSILFLLVMIPMMNLVLG